MNRRDFLRVATASALPCAWPVATLAQLRAPDVEYEPSPPAVVDAMLDLARVGAADTLIDLGSGDGRLPIAAARRGARGIGVDIDPQRIREAEANARQAGVSGRVRFVLGDLYEADLSQATVVTLFLWPDINLKLRPRLQRLAPGTRIVSHWHDMGDWPPTATRRIRTDRRIHPVYLWVIPPSA